MNTPPRDKVVFSTKLKCFTMGTTKLLGAHNALSRWYWPWKKEQGHAARESTGGAGHWMGIRNGHRLGKDLKLLIASKYKKAPLRSKAHSAFYRLMDILEHMDLRPMAVELAVGSATGRVGTGVDLVLLNVKTGGLLPCELKCGFDGYWNTVESKTLSFLPPLEQVPTTPRNQAILQLILTRELMRTTYPTAQIEAGIVIRLSPSADGSFDAHYVGLEPYHELATRDIQRRLCSPAAPLPPRPPLIERLKAPRKVGPKKIKRASSAPVKRKKQKK